MSAALTRSKRVRQPKALADFVYPSKKKPKLTEGAEAVDSLSLSSERENMSEINNHPGDEEMMSRIDELPAELLFQILHHLPIKSLSAASGVCKKWRRLCKKTSLWRCISFEETEIDKLPWYFWKRLQKLGTTCLDLHACVNPMISAPRKAIKSIIKLTNVHTLYLGVIEKADLLQIIENMPQLKTLRVMCLLPPLSRNSTSIIEEERMLLYDIGRMSVLKNLEDLAVSSVYNLCVPAFAFWGGMESFEKLKKLTKLVLTNFEGMGLDDLRFVRGLPNLEHLELGNCSSFLDVSLVHLSELKNLKSLSLTRAHCVCCDEPCFCFTRPLKGLRKLQKLTLKVCRIPNDLTESLKELPELKSFEIWPYMDMIFTPIAEDSDREKFVQSYIAIFQGLQHIPWISIGILETSMQGFFNPFDWTVGNLIADMFIQLSYHQFRRSNEDMDDPAFIDRWWDGYNHFLFYTTDEDDVEEGWSDVREEGDCPTGASSGSLIDSKREKRVTSMHQKKGKKKEVTESERVPQTPVYDSIKNGLIDLLPTSRLTFYLVKKSDSESAVTEMFYIARKEEHFNMPMLTQI